MSLVSRGLHRPASNCETSTQGGRVNAKGARHNETVGRHSARAAHNNISAKGDRHLGKRNVHLPRWAELHLVSNAPAGHSNATEGHLKGAKKIGLASNLIRHRVPSRLVRWTPPNQLRIVKTPHLGLQRVNEAVAEARNRYRADVGMREAEGKKNHKGDSKET
jgi:hypothetical protein